MSQTPKPGRLSEAHDRVSLSMAALGLAGADAGQWAFCGTSAKADPAPSGAARTLRSDLATVLNSRLKELREGRPGRAFARGLSRHTDWT